MVEEKNLRRKLNLKKINLNMTVTDFIGDTSQNSEMLKLKQKKSSLPLEQHTYFLYSPVGLQMSSENSYENPDTQLLLRPRMRPRPLFWQLETTSSWCLKKIWYQSTLFIVIICLRLRGKSLWIRAGPFMLSVPSIGLHCPMVDNSHPYNSSIKDLKHIILCHFK